MSLNKTVVIVFGPRACGKTRNAHRLAAYFKAVRTIDGPVTSGTICPMLGQGTNLVLNDLDARGALGLMARLDEKGYRSTVIEFETAMELLANQEHPSVKVETSHYTDRDYRTTTIPLAHRDHQPSFVKLGDTNLGTTLILQQMLLTFIETTISRADGVALVKALRTHFDIPDSEA
jgi:hypothetical protein